MINIDSVTVRCVVALMSSGAACNHERIIAPQPTAASSGAEQHAATELDRASPPELRFHMRAAVTDAVQARDALLAGELSRAQRAAERLARMDCERILPQDWKHWVTRVQQSASELSTAPNLDEAAAELGRLAVACGDCHDRHREADPSKSAPMPWRDPPEDFDARMHRHQLGVAQLWDGLVLPSEDAWRSGTVTITRAPLTSPRASGAEPVDDGTRVRIEAVRALAKQARSAATYQERERVFGAIVARCADCHVYERPLVPHEP